MARISEKSNRYRTKDQMVSDVVIALNSQLSVGGKYSVLHAVCWQWTEFSGKYKGCEWWTEGAILQYAADRKSNRLRHEHAVPRSVVIRMLFDLSPATTKSVQSICETFLIGVVVIKEEDNVLNNEYRKSMPPEFFDPLSPEYHDLWLRYKKCGLKVIRRCWEA